MSSVQYVAIGVAVLLVIALITALIATRRRDTWEGEPVNEELFLAQPPTDTLALLGEPERPIEDVTIDPAVEQEEHLGTIIEPTPTTAWAPTEQAPVRPTEHDLPAATAASAQAAGNESAAATEAQQPGSGNRMVSLSSIIATTSDKMVDLGDPDVRRMLTDLAKLAIDQATTHSAEGRTLDAVLQLTEAERISRTLGMEEPAERIREMLEELRMHL